MTYGATSKKQFLTIFVERTEHILAEYKGKYDATLLVNCLLGLLILPHEEHFKRLPKGEGGTLTDWGVDPAAVECVCEFGSQHDLTGRQFLTKLRNCVAHFGFQPTDDGKDVTGIVFQDDRKRFTATMKLDEIRTFVKRLGQELKGDE